MYTISGTDVGPILGYGKFGVNARTVWERRKLGVQQEIQNKSALEWGVRNENTIALKFIENKNYKFVDVSKYARKNKLQYSINDRGEVVVCVSEWMTGTPDRLLKNTDTQEIEGLEIKTSKEHWHYCPKTYEYQCRWYMMLLGVRKWHLAVLIGSCDYREYVFERDANIENDMLKQVVAFREKYLLGDAEPMREYFEVNSENYTVSDEVDGIVTQIGSTMSQIDELERNVKSLKDKLGEIIGDNYGCKGARYTVRYPVRTRKTFDSKLFISDHPDLSEETLSKYYKISRYRQLGYGENDAD